MTHNRNNALKPAKEYNPNEFNLGGMIAIHKEESFKCFHEHWVAMVLLRDGRTFYDDTVYSSMEEAQKDCDKSMEVLNCFKNNPDGKEHYFHDNKKTWTAFFDEVLMFIPMPIKE